MLITPEAVFARRFSGVFLGMVGIRFGLRYKDTFLRIIFIQNLFLFVSRCRKRTPHGTASPQLARTGTGRRVVARSEAAEAPQLVRHGRRLSAHTQLARTGSGRRVVDRSEAAVYDDEKRESRRIPPTTTPRPTYCANAVFTAVAIWSCVVCA